MTEDKHRISSVDGAKYKVAAPDAFLRSKKLTHRRKIARQMLKSMKATEMFGRDRLRGALK